MSNEPRYIWAFISPPSDSCHIYSRMQSGILRLAVTICSWLFSCLDNEWVVFTEVVSGLHIEERRVQVSKKWKIESEQECCFLPHYSSHRWCCSRAALPIEGRVPGKRDDEHQLFKVVSTIIALSWYYLFWSLVPLLKVALGETRWQMKGEEEEKEHKWSNSDF